MLSGVPAGDRRVPLRRLHPPHRTGLRGARAGRDRRRSANAATTPISPSSPSSRRCPRTGSSELQRVQSVTRSLCLPLRSLPASRARRTSALPSAAALAHASVRAREDRAECSTAISSPTAVKHGPRFGPGGHLLAERDAVLGSRGDVDVVLDHAREAERLIPRIAVRTILDRLRGVLQRHAAGVGPQANVALRPPDRRRLVAFGGRLARSRCARG